MKDFLNFFDMDKVWYAEDYLSFRNLNGEILDSVGFFNGLSPNTLRIEDLYSKGIPSDFIAFLPIEGVAHFLPKLLVWLDDEQEGVDEIIFSLLAEERLSGEHVYLMKFLNPKQTKIVKGVMGKSIERMLVEDGEFSKSMANKAEIRWEMNSERGPQRGQ